MATRVDIHLYIILLLEGSPRILYYYILICTWKQTFAICFIEPLTAVRAIHEWSMTLCTNCAQAVPYLYTVYQSVNNVRLEQCVRHALLSAL